MTVFVTICVVLLIVGIVWAIAGAERDWTAWGYPADEPNLFGCLLAFLAITVLAGLGLMKLGAWLW